MPLPTARPKPTTADRLARAWLRRMLRDGERAEGTVPAAPEAARRPVKSQLART